MVEITLVALCMQINVRKLISSSLSIVEMKRIHMNAAMRQQFFVIDTPFHVIRSTDDHFRPRR